MATGEEEQSSCVLDDQFAHQGFEMSQAGKKVERIMRFASALWHGDRGNRGPLEAYIAEAKQIVDALPGLDREDVIELAQTVRS